MDAIPSMPFRKPPQGRRHPVPAADDELVRVTRPASPPLPIEIVPAGEALRLASWCASRAEWLGRELNGAGALLLRGFSPVSIEEFEAALAAVAGTLTDYDYASTPRTRVSGKVYTSTEYPASETIPLHNEMSYAGAWPLTLAFLCQLPAQNGGATTLADSRRVYERISEPTRQRFETRRVRYVRNYGGRLDLSWQAAFDTNDPAEVERVCRAHGIACEWRADQRLRTIEVRNAVATHAATGERVWFNQAHLFHVSALDPATRQALLQAVAEEDLPRNASWGDGSPIEPDLLDEVRAAYAAETIPVDWQAHDVLLVNNMLVAHGRAPFQGARRVFVGMANEIGAPVRER